MTPTEAKNVGSNLIQLLAQQRLLCRQLKELAQKQRSLVDGNNPEMLLRVLAGRQRIIDRLSAIDRNLKPIRSEWQEISRSLPDQQRQEAQSLINEVQDILGDIIARDEKDTEALSQNQQKIGREIKKTQVGKKMNKAYGQSAAAVQSKYFDTVSG